MTRFQHLRKVNFTNNQISDASSLASIKYLTHLNLKQNAIENLDSFNVPGTFEFLEELNLENNKLFVRLAPNLELGVDLHPQAEETLVGQQ